MNNPAQSAIAVIIDLAERGEIDPWDVQVIEVIDRFLKDLVPESDLQDLAQSGQAFLWASMLVLLKANTLHNTSMEELPLEEDLEEENPVSYGENSFTALENYLKRRTGNPPIRKRRVTLGELIQQIEDIATQLAKNPAPVLKTARRLSKRQQAKAITHLAHEENITEVAQLLDKFLTNKVALKLQDLQQLWSKEQKTSQLRSAQGANHDKVMIFSALLLLSAQSKVLLSQEEFYQDLTISSLQ